MKTRSEIVDAICKAVNQWTSGDYSPREFYCNINGQHERGNAIARAMDAESNEDVIEAIDDCLRGYFHPEDPFMGFLLKLIRIDWI